MSLNVLCDGTLCVVGLPLTLCKYWHYAAFVALLLFEGCKALKYYLGYRSLSIFMYFDTFSLLVSTMCDTMYFLLDLFLWFSQNDGWIKSFLFAEWLWCTVCVLVHVIPLWDLCILFCAHTLLYHRYIECWNASWLSYVMQHLIVTLIHALALWNNFNCSIAIKCGKFNIVRWICNLSTVI